MSEAACVKQEPGELGARGEPEEGVSPVCVKEEPELEPEEASVKAEALSELYADHIIKDELVLGPERRHRPTGGLMVPECGVEVCLPAVGGRGSQRALRDCAVRLERLPLHALRLRTPAPDITPGHSQPNHLPVEDTCHICSMKFALKPDLKNHILTHIYKPEADTENEIYSNKLSKEEYLCDICDKTFALKVDLMEHVVVHIHVPGEEWGEDTEDKGKITVGGLECDATIIPEPARADRDTAPRHAADNTDAQRHSINNTGTYQRHASNNKTDAQRHATDDTDTSPGHATDNNTDTSQRHATEKPYACKTCHKKFTKSSNFYRHKKLHTGEKLACEICDKQFNQLYRLKEHLLVHTGEGTLDSIKKTYSCEMCNKKFASLQNLKYHTRLHTEEKPYTCETCHKKFPSLQILKQHITLHTGEKPYSCKSCQQKFSKLQSLKRHTGLHTGEKSYSCESCEKKFKDKKSLHSHIVIHTGEKPYSCEVCKSMFAHKSTLVNPFTATFEVE